jgi:hypothetical protein
MRAGAFDCGPALLNCIGSYMLVCLTECVLQGSDLTGFKHWGSRTSNLWALLFSWFFPSILI